MTAPPAPTRESAWLALTAIAGQIMMTVLTARLARSLSLEAFETFAVTAAIFMLLVRVAPLGSDKLAVRVLPPMLRRAEWSGLRGFLRFARRRAGRGTLLVAVLACAWAFGLRDLGDPARAVFLLALVVLPVGVLAQMGLKCVTAVGGVRFAKAMVRLAVPAVALGLVLLAPVFGLALRGLMAVGAWGIGWMIAAALLAQTGIIALDWLGAPPEAVEAYATAATIVGLMLVLSTSTNRGYAREIALCLDRGSRSGMEALARRRRRWLLPCLVAVLAAICAFSRPILTVFRPEFVEDGLWPLRIFAAAAAFTMYFGFAPTVLKYSRRNVPLFATLAVTAAIQIVLLVLLVPPLGATDAALGYGLSAVLMYGVLAIRTRAEIRALRPVAAGT
ncbi:lipopolysaccharide biosynthesis protein [Meridianimarinicoccus sp. RP-17]|uniref:lipopolysaccharide biosynthesis protein n=1 Tax=Meridianimarinicoccus zhengii TaxID=2056810 RepID=UPI000DABC832|nr:polysaccharide biosynthesis C-terminal domain-containing protein [Phycocomes zhengii]